TGSVFGRVTDAAGNAIGGASVSVDGSSYSAVTLDDGSYQLGNVSASPMIRRLDSSIIQYST
ncbi:MAG: carboxypeptidase-like regulatory domain-containing protein, partial [Pseudomonadota bacterium]